ncbi:MAG: hypothetical protein U0R68_14605 [Candidatus Nanopelagicales bacterium]
MSGGGSLIYAVLIGMWAVILVPMWLRRHDEAQESKSADRFARAMGTLRRSGSWSSSGSGVPVREVLMPRRPASAHDTQVVVTGPTAAASPAAAAAARRRNVLAVLGALLVGWIVLVVMHKVPTWSLVVPAGLVVGFLVVARRQVALAAEMRRRQLRRSTLADAAREAETRYAGGTARRGGRAVDPAPVRTQAPVAAPAARAAEPVAAEGSWSAVPTTLPTYVTAPRATRVPRVIDLTTPGSWSGAAMVEKARESLAAEPVAEGAMRVESFEIAVPRDPQVRAGVYGEDSTAAAPAQAPAARGERRDARYRDSSYAERYVADGSEIEALAAEDDELDSLLGDPRTGVHGPTWRRAANG